MVDELDMFAELAHVAIRQYTATSSVTGSTSISSIEISLGDRTTEVLPLLSGGYLELDGPLQECMLTFSFYPSAAIMLHDDIGAPGFMKSALDAWAGQARWNTSSSYTGSYAAVAPSREKQRFRVSILLGDINFM